MWVGFMVRGVGWISGILWAGSGRGGGIGGIVCMPDPRREWREARRTLEGGSGRSRTEIYCGAER